jgi:hypothetical protein
MPSAIVPVGCAACSPDSSFAGYVPPGGGDVKRVVVDARRVNGNEIGLGQESDRPVAVPALRKPIGAQGQI